MEFSGVISVLQESLYLILVFAFFLGYAMFRGKQSLVNLILGLYFALLISLEFPYYDKILSGVDSERFSDSMIMIVIFAIFTLGGTFLFSKLMPRDYDDSSFSGFGSKLLLALLGSALVMAYSYHVLPVTDLITPGSPIQTLFGSEASFFWWLLAPIAGLMFL